MTALHTASTLTGKMLITITFCGLWTYTPEVYPTSIRSTGVSAMSSSWLISCIICRYVGKYAVKLVSMLWVKSSEAYIHVCVPTKQICQS